MKSDTKEARNNGCKRPNKPVQQILFYSANSLLQGKEQPHRHHQ